MAMDPRTIFELPDEATQELMRKDLGEDPQKLERQIELFKEWLHCEPYLPSDVDDRLIVTFVRHCKCDVEKAKRKFENFLSNRVRLKSLYTKNDASLFEGIPVHRLVWPCPILTPEGYRVGIGRLPEDANQFDLLKLFHFTLMILDMLLLEDECSAIIVVIDLKNLSAAHLGKMNFKLLAEGAHLIYDINPLRYKAMHFLNVPYVPETLITFVKKLVPRKIVERTYGHKNLEDLHKHLDKKFLPIEWGGTTHSWDEAATKWKNYFLYNKQWPEKRSKLVLKGKIPQHKASLYSFEEFEMGGSFRQLSID